MITVRPYQQTDQESLLKLLTELQDHVASIDPEGKQREPAHFDADAYTQHLLKKVSQSEGIIFLAEIDGDIAGCIAGSIPELSEEDLLETYSSREGVIEELIVREQFRGKNIGHVLMQNMEEYFQSNQCEFIRVGVFAPNERAYHFYKKMGYKDRYLEVLKKLS